MQCNFIINYIVTQADIMYIKSMNLITYTFNLPFDLLPVADMSTSSQNSDIYRLQKTSQIKKPKMNTYFVFKSTANLFQLK